MEFVFLTVLDLCNRKIYWVGIVWFGRCVCFQIQTVRSSLLPIPYLILPYLSLPTASHLNTGFSYIHRHTHTQGRTSSFSCTYLPPDKPQLIKSDLSIVNGTPWDFVFFYIIQQVGRWLQTQ